jgi:6-phosphogluconolactonase
MIWSRRRFLQQAGSLSAAGALSAALPSEAWPIGEEVTQMRAAGSPPRFAYVASASTYGEHHIAAFAVNGDRWNQIQAIDSRSPNALVLHPNQNVLYVANQVSEHEGLPCATVEAFRIDTKSGELSLLKRQRLSLSGTHPSCIAISPDGRSMVVALDGGGAYNLLPLDENGVPEQVSSIIKETGAGLHPEHQGSARPRSVLFDPVHHNLLSADLGCDRLSVFSVSDGKMTRNHHVNTVSGSGPARLVLHPSSDVLYAASELDGSLSSYAYQRSTGKIGKPLQTFANPKASAKVIPRHASLVVHPSGKFLYSSLSDSDGVITVWRVHAVTGTLSQIQSFNAATTSPRGLHVSQNGSDLYVLDEIAGSVSRICIDQSSGELGSTRRQVEVIGATSIALKYT